jgi:hypothetical protein
MPVFLRLADYLVSMDIEAIFVVSGQGWMVVMIPARKQASDAMINSFIFV